ncbi:MAG TPA: hypothetical protein PLF91_07460 [Mycolicibacterium fallax]|nr:hypothetical protein [Mycolicibacterium fallax]
MNPNFTLIARTLLAVMFVGFYGFIVLQVLGRDTEFLPGVKDVAMFLLGALTTSVVTVVGFFFNSSQGSAEKTVQLARAAERDAP